MEFESVQPGRKVMPTAMIAGTDPSSAECYYDADEAEFLKAMELYQRKNSRKFPTFIEVLDVAKALGYRLVAEPQPLPKYRQRQ